MIWKHQNDLVNIKFDLEILIFELGHNLLLIKNNEIKLSVSEKTNKKNCMIEVLHFLKTYETNCQDITEVLLKVLLNTITLTCSRPEYS